MKAFPVGVSMNFTLLPFGRCDVRLLVLLFAIVASAALPGLAQDDGRRKLPDHVPPKRTSQIHDGFGINSDLPRDPYLPWNRWWWTRMFDAGFKWIRIGQYENSSDRTSWDWIEQKRDVFSSSPELEDAVDSLGTTVCKSRCSFSTAMCCTHRREDGVPM